MILAVKTVMLYAMTPGMQSFIHSHLLEQFIEGINLAPEFSY